MTENSVRPLDTPSPPRGSNTIMESQQVTQGKALFGDALFHKGFLFSAKPGVMIRVLRVDGYFEVWERQRTPEWHMVDAGDVTSQGTPESEATARRLTEGFTPIADHHALGYFSCFDSMTIYHALSS